MKEKMVEQKKREMSISLEEDIIKGIENLELDEKVAISLNVKITSIGRDTWDKKKPISVRAQVLSGKILDNEIMEEIDEAENTKDLEKVEKKIREK